jgi:hypothetical protein
VAQVIVLDLAHLASIVLASRCTKGVASTICATVCSATCARQITPPCAVTTRCAAPSASTTTANAPTTRCLTVQETRIRAERATLHSHVGARVVKLGRRQLRVRVGARARVCVCVYAHTLRKDVHSGRAIP